MAATPDPDWAAAGVPTAVKSVNKKQTIARWIVTTILLRFNGQEPFSSRLRNRDVSMAGDDGRRFGTHGTGAPDRDQRAA